LCSRERVGFNDCGVGVGTGGGVIDAPIYLREIVTALVRDRVLLGYALSLERELMTCEEYNRLALPMIPVLSDDVPNLDAKVLELERLVPEYADAELVSSVFGCTAQRAEAALAKAAPAASSKAAPASLDDHLCEGWLKRGLENAVRETNQWSNERREALRADTDFALRVAPDAECPECLSDNVKTLRVHNPDTMQVNVDVTLRCSDCQHTWKGLIESDYSKELHVGLQF
jgi:hypothetical protein